MPEQGKYEQARAKAGLTELSAPEPLRTDSEEATPQPPPQAEEQDSVTPFRRIKGMCGPPDPAIVTGRVPGTNGQDGADGRALRGNAREVSSQIRAVRHRIERLDAKNPPMRVITVTSSTVAEGKTTIALNLGAALTQLDGSHRVVVVDGDMPAPALHGAAGMKDEALLEGEDDGKANTLRNRGARTGLWDILKSEDLDLNGNVYETAIERLDIIPGRVTTAEDGLETPLNERCLPLLMKLRDLYSYVIIDTPPVHIEGYASTFGRCSDGVILVTRLESTPRDVVKRTIDDLEKAGAHVCGCVATHHTHHVPSFIYKFFGTRPGHYYGYGYGYYYGYGYGYDGYRGRRRKRPDTKDQSTTSSA